jgi:hypothetical protein
MLRNIACCATWLTVYGADWLDREWANLCCAKQFCATWLIVYGPHLVRKWLVNMWLLKFENKWQWSHYIQREKFQQLVLGRNNRLLSLIWHGPHWTQRVQQFFYCCVCIRYRGNVFTEPLPSNDRGILQSRCLATIRGLLPSRCLATIGGYTETHLGTDPKENTTPLLSLPRNRPRTDQKENAPTA